MFYVKSLRRLIFFQNYKALKQHYNQIQHDINSIKSEIEGTFKKSKIKSLEKEIVNLEVEAAEVTLSLEYYE